MLTHYNPDLDLVLECDASPYGIGAVLSHQLEDGSTRPITFASCSLNPAKRRYAHLDKEGLAIVYGVKKFNQYLFGRKFVIKSDHKPHTIYGICSSATMGVDAKCILLSTSQVPRIKMQICSPDYLCQKPPQRFPGQDRRLLLETLECSPITATQIKA